MSFKKKLFSIFGPLILAVLIIVGLLLSPFQIGKVTQKTIKRASTSMAVNVIKGDAIKNKAMESGYYVPFFGSSELSRIDAFHPSVLAERYNRNYRPFLLGAAGTQSLSQFMMLQSMGEEMQGKKAVFIISPQWFVSRGVSKEMFELYYSPLQIYQWLYSIDEIDEAAEYFAQRMLTFPSVKSDTALKIMLRKVVNGEKLNKLQKKKCKIQIRIYQREDELFSQLGMFSKEHRIEKSMEKLPSKYNVKELDKLAYKIGKKATSNNEFQISNGFYSKRILPVKNSLKNSQVNYDYRYSPEFSDFQLVLDEIAKRDMDVLFIIPPVNKRWSDYTGLSQEMISDFSKKIMMQLNDQGFERVLNLTDKNDEPYFMTDTIHIGWRGWIAVDEKVAPFLNSTGHPKMNYHLNPSFYSEEWQNKNPN